MIKKERKIPLKIRKLTALLRRLPPSHPKRSQIEKQLAKYTAGYHGERSIEYYLSFLPEKQYLIFHDLRLSSGDHFFQLDTLLVSPFFILILEVKNISGTLYFDNTFHQLIRTIRDKEEGFNDPLLQVEHQKAQLANWLQQHKFPPVPIQTLVVISNPTTIISASEENHQHSEKVIRSPKLRSSIEQFAHTHKIEKLPKKQLQRLSNRLIKKHTPHGPDILSQFSIAQKDLIKGAHCPKCFALPMKRIRRSWVCPTCGHSDRTAYLESLQDYSLLLGTTITNRQLREFLQLQSRSIATNILTSMNLEHSGTNKGRKYKL